MRGLCFRTPALLFPEEVFTDQDWGQSYLSPTRRDDALWVEGAWKDGEVHLSRPLSLDSLNLPLTGDEGDVAFLRGPEDATGVKKDVVALQNMVEYLRYPKRFVHDLRELRLRAGYQRAVYAPLLATPANIPILAYAGIDLLDILRATYDSAKGRFLTQEGPLEVDHLEEWPCLCPGCENRDLLDHNVRTTVAEVRRARDAIKRGALRELVERRAANNPWDTAVLRELDYRCYEWQELHATVSGPEMKAYSQYSLSRPEVGRFRRRLRERYSRPPSAQVLLLLPCSARKPYSSSKSHRLFRGAIRGCGNAGAVHVVVVTSPLGLVPEELELFYPAQDYDVPVTGDWSADESVVVTEALEAFLQANSYEKVIIHLAAESDIVSSAVTGGIVTSRGDPRSAESLERLTNVLRDATAEFGGVSRGQRQAEELLSIARFQFGDGAEDLVEGCRTKGRYPNLRILKEGRQVAALTRERGMLSLSLLGGEILSRTDRYWVEIDDFYPEGNVFAVGVLNAHEDIRVGDEVVVRHDGEVRAVGVARMNPVEMKESNRGEAVRVRHRRKRSSGES